MPKSTTCGPCPQCGGRTKVLRTRTVGLEVHRSRVCLDPTCGHQFRTVELHVADRRAVEDMARLGLAGRVLKLQAQVDELLARGR